MLSPGQIINQYSFRWKDPTRQTVPKLTLKYLQRCQCFFPAEPQCHKGKFTWVYHFDSKSVITDYIKESLPSLAKKTSMVQIC